MSPRPKKIRRVSNPPVISGFKPYGGTPATGPDHTVFLHFEEYEVIRLCDFEMLNHEQASVIMGVSRPTFTRIYAGARKKIAKALVTGRQIIIEGGKVYFDSEWYSCRACGCYFNLPEMDKTDLRCPLCRSESVTPCGTNIDDMAMADPCCSEFCFCIKCGYKKPHEQGDTCNRELCPECGTVLIANRIISIE